MITQEQGLENPANIQKNEYDQQIYKQGIVHNTSQCGKHDKIH